MILSKTLRSILFLSAVWLLSHSPLWAADGIISKVSVSSGNFCHLRFPAIRQDTLYSNRPALKDASDGDIIDFYGACDHDPLGKDEVFRQRGEYRKQRRQLPEGE